MTWRIHLRCMQCSFIILFSPNTSDRHFEQFCALNANHCQGNRKSIEHKFNLAILPVHETRCYCTMFWCSGKIVKRNQMCDIDMLDVCTFYTQCKCCSVYIVTHRCLIYWTICQAEYTNIDWNTATKWNIDSEWEMQCGRDTANDDDDDDDDGDYYYYAAWQRITGAARCQRCARVTRPHPHNFMYFIHLVETMEWWMMRPQWLLCAHERGQRKRQFKIVSIQTKTIRTQTRINNSLIASYTPFLTIQTIDSIDLRARAAVATAVLQCVCVTIINHDIHTWIHRVCHAEAEKRTETASMVHLWLCTAQCRSHCCSNITALSFRQSGQMAKWCKNINHIIFMRTFVYGGTGHTWFECAIRLGCSLEINNVFWKYVHGMRHRTNNSYKCVEYGTALVR